MVELADLLPARLHDLTEEHHRARTLLGSQAPHPGLLRRVR
ncbi:MAG: hypothetical protein M0Z51_06165 [Propionibacterium sp.]|nr:hypothetical protein [Propionibacterium sp.]